jgi:uncharacterized protein (DUF427 family)
VTSRPTPDPVAPGQESAWDFPRPPCVERATAHLVVVLDGVQIAETNDAYRVLETSHPPNYYFPPADVDLSALSKESGATFCEWKGRATYWTVRAGAREVVQGAWSYASPSPRFDVIRDHVAFYPGRMDACFVDGEAVEPQPGDFYGGWITSRVAGPFKGGPGTRGW